jgi:hypothetical protein
MEIGHSIIAMPPVIAAYFIQKHTGIRCEAALYTLIFIANVALLLALIAYYLLQFNERNRVWWTVAIIWLATTWWPYTKMDFPEPLVATILFAGFVLMRFGRNHVDFEDIHFNPRYSQIAWNWILLRHLLHVPPQPSPPEVVEKNGTALYDILPPRTWSETARWDFVWVHRRR